jgi:hypothetical protein
LTRAGFLSARNDALANVAIVATGFVTAYTGSAFPDLIVGLGDELMNADAAKEVYQAAREEDRAGGSTLRFAGLRSARHEPFAVAGVPRGAALIRKDCGRRPSASPCYPERPPEGTRRMRGHCYLWRELAAIEDREGL